MELSIIICTYNRPKILQQCLNLLIKQNIPEIEIIVVDNGNNEQTYQVVHSFSIFMPNIIYIRETQIGLAYARNRGITESKSKWILFIDDDSFVLDGFVNQAVKLTNKNEYDCIGGKYYGYLENDRPKWLPKEFESYQGNITTLQKCEYYEPIGCVVMYKKAVLEYLNGFNPKLGMKGKSIAYGEETELQYRMSNLGYVIGFEPKLKVNHLIRDEKKNIFWHMKAAYAHGRDGYFNKNYGILRLFIKNLFSLFALIFKRIPTNSIKLVNSNNFFWQNFLIDSFYGNLYYFGMIIGFLFAKTDHVYDKDRKIHLS